MIETLIISGLSYKLKIKFLIYNIRRSISPISDNRRRLP